jgi:hypothetical protein
VDWLGCWARSRRGVCSIVLSVLVIAQGMRARSVEVLAAPLWVLVLLPIMAAVVWVAAAIWEGKTVPAAPRFSRAVPPSASRQLREDANGRVFTDRGGFLFARRCFFVGTGCPPVRLTSEFVADAVRRRDATPVLMAVCSERRFWWYRDVFWWENQGLEVRDVMALVHDRERRRDRELGRARVLLDVEQSRATAPPRQRQRVPREVKQAVFSRDGGRCVDCRSDFELQYDHVIPWALGGADTVENLQLLCAPCNQSKGASF